MSASIIGGNWKLTEDPYHTDVEYRVKADMPNNLVTFYMYNKETKISTVLAGSPMESYSKADWGQDGV